MNIHDYWPEVEYQIESSEAIWRNLLKRRRDTFRGFATIEQQNGFVQPKASVHTSQGQEMLRILGFRVLEETAESLAAEERSHQKEEAIDAMNYLHSMAMLDGSLLTIDQLAAALHTEFDGVGTFPDRPISTFGLSQLTLLVAGELADTFRNRAWMEQAQDVYFAGLDQMIQAIVDGTGLLMFPFEDFDEFWHYYVAKDKVLQFRLRSNY